jgi:hypothetical protein
MLEVFDHLVLRKEIQFTHRNACQVGGWELSRGFFNPSR